MIKTLEISLRYARTANWTMEDVIRLLGYDGIELNQTSSNTYEFEVEDEDDDQIECEISEALCSAGIPEDEFWFGVGVEAKY